MRALKLWGLLLLGTLGACATAPSAADVTALPAAIINGTTDSGHPAVGVLIAQTTKACTGTLIGPRTVLTAAHCVINKDPPHQPWEPVEFRLGGLSGAAHPAEAAVPNPAYAGENAEDIALVRLSAPVTGVTPMPLCSTAPVIGESVVFVGYGYPSASDASFGTKRMGENVIEEVTTQTFSVFGSASTDGHACTGDSGGPALAACAGGEALLGVISASGQNCLVETKSVRVDAFLAWILEQAAGDVSGGPGADQAPPTVAITAPPDGAQVGPDFSVVVSATDDVGVVRVELRDNGTAVGELLAPPFSFPVTDRAAGPHALEARAYDAAGKSGSATIQVQVGGGGPAAGDGGTEAAGGGGGCRTSGTARGGALGLALLVGLAGGPRHRRPTRSRGAAPAAQSP